MDACHRPDCLPAGASTQLDEKVTAALRSPQFQAALRYAVQAGSADPGPMFLSPDYRQRPGKGPLLRGLLLACVQPGVDGSLPGYTPSPAFAQTHAKSWARNGPRGKRGAYLAALAAGEEPPGASGIDAVAWQVVPWLDGRSAVMASLVCREWRQLVGTDAACQAAIHAAEAENEEAERAASAAAHAWALAARHLGSDSYSDYDRRFPGYGSP